MTDSTISAMSACELLAEDFFLGLFDLPELDRVRLSAIATERARQLGIKTAFNKVLRGYEKAVSAPKPARPYRDTSGRFLHEQMARELINCGVVCRIGNLVHTRRGLVWVPDAAALNGAILERCPDSTKSNRAEVAAWLQASSEVPERKLSPPELIPFANGVLDLNGPDRVRPYMQEDTFLSVFPARYDPDTAPADSVAQTFDRLADHSAGVVRLLYQMIGLLLFRENRYRAAFFLFGESGCNGKSSLLNLIRQFVGPGNCSSMSIQDFDGERGRFRVAELVGKAANLCDDLPARHLFDSSMFKAITTGGTITGERKGDQPFSFTPFCKMIFACNELPTMSDHTGGAMSRMVIVPLQHNFSLDEDFRPQAKDKNWTQAELDYLAVLAVRGLRGVIEGNGVCIPSESAELLDEYKILNDPVSAFVRYCGDEDKLIVYRRTETVFNDFRAFCCEAGFRSEMKRKTFSNRICSLLDLECRQQRDTGGGRSYYFQPKTPPVMHE
ncbi:MAG: hypothetical protein KBS74_01320 [Clostridiales bacterium]|nr:hypothetical protein [Candidatus Cacconaster stercorequi]